MPRPRDNPLEDQIVDAILAAQVDDPNVTRAKLIEIATREMCRHLISRKPYTDNWRD